MIDQIIPVVFTDLLNQNNISINDIEDYERLSHIDVVKYIIDEISEENVNQTFKGFAAYLHESSSGTTFRSTTITCNVLHLAIKLGVPMCVGVLLDYNANPTVDLIYKHTSSKESNNFPEDDTSSANSTTISTLALAKAGGNKDIIALIEKAMNAINPPKAPMKVSAKNKLLKKPTGKESEEGYESDIETAPSTKPHTRYKKRLILGDGNFSYSRALVKKQQDNGKKDLATALTVTEYCQQEELKEKYAQSPTNDVYKNFQANLNALGEMGVEVIFGVDATKIHTMFNDRRFKRIHFNFPYFYDEGLTAQQKKEKTRELVGNFFRSAAKIQQPGDRIHMGLVTGFDDPVWYEDATYGVAEFSEKEGYAYIKKRDFIDPDKGVRYPGYSHVKTSSNATVTTAETGREFIFEKKIQGKNYKNSNRIKTTTKGVKKTVLIEKMTDDDSSSYVEHSSSDEVPSKTENSLKSSSDKGVKKLLAPMITLGIASKSSFSKKDEMKNKKTQTSEEKQNEHFGKKPT